jgi:hypothetical protein
LSDSKAEVTPVPGDVERLADDLAHDLAIVSDLLGEIATCWRRAAVSAEDLPVSRPLRLQDAVRQLDADLRSLAGARPEQRVDLALSAAGQFGMLRAGIAAAQSVTQPGRIPAGDAALWDSAAEAMGRAGTRLLSLILAVAPITDWWVNRTPRPEAAKPWLLIELG